MFGVLIIIFGGDRIAGALRVAGELEIFFGNVGCRSPDFYVRSVGLVHARQRILVVMDHPYAVTTAHALVSDRFSWFAVPPTPFAAALMPPLLFTRFTVTKLTVLTMRTRCGQRTAVNRRASAFA